VSWILIEGTATRVTFKVVAVKAMQVTAAIPDSGVQDRVPKLIEDGIFMVK
jgi:hypothetical protein